VETDLDIVAYAAGTVIFGYLLASPLWAVGALWNRQKRWPRVNPWILPLVVIFLVYLGFVISLTTRPAPNDWVVALGILPAALGCSFQAWNYRRK